MTSNRKNPGVAFWATVVVVVALLYVASFGPACWYLSREPYDHSFRRLFERTYWPIGRAASEGPKIVERSVFRYGELGMPVGGYVHLPCEPARQGEVDDRSVLILRTRLKR
jgi:hypothetical protein